VIAVFVWIAAVVAAAVVLIFCGYELRWKSARLRTDLEQLHGVAADLRSLQADLANAAARLR
jgi:hypothetical protein